MSASRAKGTGWEVDLRDIHLRPLYYPDTPYGTEEEHLEHPLQRLDDVARHRRHADGDFVGVPYTIEAKKTERPLFQQWARKLEGKVGKAWALIWSGDRRTKTGTGPYVLEPLELWKLKESILEELLKKDEFTETYYRAVLEGMKEG